MASAQIASDEAYRRLQERETSYGPHQHATTRPATRATSRPGTAVVFVCDASGSMHDVFHLVRERVAGELSKLNDNDLFEVICFQGDSYSIMHKHLLHATADRKAEAVQYLSRIDPRRETNPIPALAAAFKFTPDTIFLLSDGDYPDHDAVSNSIRAWERLNKVKINTIAFITDAETAGVDFLRKIADATGGVYRTAKESAPPAPELAPSALPAAKP